MSAYFSLCNGHFSQTQSHPKLNPLDLSLVCTKPNSLNTLEGTLGQNRVQKDINNKIEEKGKMMNLLDSFQSPVRNQNHFKDFSCRF